MKGFAIHNAPTDHGGIIPSTQLRSSQQGNTFVRAGDGHFCPKCKCWSTVVKSNDHVIFDGKAVAFVGDSLTCGAKILYQQSHVVGNTGGGILGSAARSSSQPVSSQQNLTNSFNSEEKYEIFYVQNYKTDVFIQHRALITPSETDSIGVGLLQMISGTVSYFLNYRVMGSDLFISVSINAHPLSNDAKVFPFCEVVISRDNEIHTTTRLKKEPGFWDTSNNKSPVGSSTIKLPKPNLSVVKVKIKLGYTAQHNGSVGIVIPTPPTKSYEFSISSFAEKI